MAVVVLRGQHEYEVQVAVGPGAIARDLAACLGADPNDRMHIDGVAVAADMPLAELRMGHGSIVELSPSAPSSPIGVAGPFNRPPRLQTGRAAELIAPPAVPGDPGAPVRFGWATLVLPVLLGVAMALLIHPRMAAFAVFSPVMLLANWMEDRRRHRRTRKEDGRAFSTALAGFVNDIEDVQKRERLWRSHANGSPREMANRALSVGAQLWERRSGHTDFMSVAIGTGCVDWDPPTTTELSGEVASAIRHLRTLHDVPIPLELAGGEVVGIAGDRSIATGMARQMLVRAAVDHGPADLAISVFTERSEDWDWVKWLPHVLAGRDGRRRLATTIAETEAVVDLLPDEDTDPGLQHLVLIDLPDLLHQPRARLRTVLQHGAERRVAGIALAGRAVDLPSLCGTVVLTQQDRTHIRHPDATTGDVTPWTVGRARARGVARALARVVDPEAEVVGVDLPAAVFLDDVLELGEDLARSIKNRWAGGSGPAAPIGLGRDGPVVIDLVADGPHALLGGTTGAGKSELLRTLVAGLAASCGPDTLNFVLVDYKGGSAFDACADLPHTVGLVTDLDDHLAQRALTCLNAELRYRELRLRQLGVADIKDVGSGAVLPRLLVVIDEFAALATELPDFMDALVGIAQRGRSLGVHLLLATQRPAGVIGDNIKANTNLRIALRVQDTADSIDIVGNGDAVGIPAKRPGRGLMRRGPTDVVEFQTALVSSTKPAANRSLVDVRPFAFAHEQSPAACRAAVKSDAASDLERLVSACRQAATDAGMPPPRSPWPDPLPTRVNRDEIGAGGSGAVIGLADEPERQRIWPATWDPRAGNLLLYGLPGSGTTTTLATLAVTLAATREPSLLHIHVLDFDDQELGPLRRLPHVGSVIGGSERERQLRLLRRLSAELESRRLDRSARSGDFPEAPTIVTLIDNYGGLADAFGDAVDMDVHSLVARLVADGPGVGILMVIAAKQPSDVPTRVAAAVPERLAFRLADRYDYTGLGLPPVDPPLHPGRAFAVGTGREVQIALPHQANLEAAVAAIQTSRADPLPWAIAVLPQEVPLADFVATGRISPDEWFLPLGIGDSSLRPAGLVLRDGEHALITGPARSGKTTALVNAARVARSADRRLRILAISPRQSGLHSCAAVDEMIHEASLEQLSESDGDVLLLIDDAELVDDGEQLTRLIKRRHRWLRVVAAGSADAIRGLYGHWTQDLRRSRIGCALRPNPVVDGDLWHTTLPRLQGQLFPVGRGYLLSGGHTELIQLGHQ